MLTTTSSNLGTNTESHTEQSPSLLPSTSYSCTSCHISFPNGQDQRIHMKEPWHVYNIKRRIASLPPISPNAFSTQIEKKVHINRVSLASRSRSVGSGSDKSSSDNEASESASPFQCLFCSQTFSSSTTGLTSNVSHMLTAHGLFIPNPNKVSDLPSFIGYLATEVRTWHECLYCGATKPSTASIQSHMRDKAHCRLNVDREPELLDFWESPQWGVDDDNGDGTVTTVLEQDGSTLLSATDLRVADGRVIESRDAARAAKKTSRKKQGLVASTSTIQAPLPLRSEAAESTELTLLPVSRRQQLASGRQLARRDEMSILGLSVHERQALALAEKKAQRSEAVARRAREWVYARGANSQKYDQIDNQGKWGKQQHKLFPR